MIRIVFFTVFWGYCLGQVSAQYQMLIITPERFKEAVIPLRDYRTQNGILTEIKTLSQTGYSLQEIQTFIKTCYSENPMLKYLLLVGDADALPAPTYQNKAADWFYADMNNDDFPELAVGRFSGVELEDISNQVRKTLEYEAQFCAKTLGIASANPLDENHIQAILAQFKHAINASDFTAKNLLDVVNEGCSFIHYSGVGTSQGWITTGFSTFEVAQLQNRIYPVIISLACDNGDFIEQTCFAEHWLRSPHGAAAALMSSTLQPYEPPLTAHNAMIDYLFQHQNPTFGNMVLYGFKAMMEEFDAYETVNTWLIFGDPALKLNLFPDNSVKTVTPKPPLTIFPNPVDETLNITISDDLWSVDEIEISDIQGKVITRNLDAISNLKSGIYILKIRLKTSDGSFAEWVEKFVKR